MAVATDTIPTLRVFDLGIADAFLWALPQMGICNALRHLVDIQATHRPKVIPAQAGLAGILPRRSSISKNTTRSMQSLQMCSVLVLHQAKDRSLVRVHLNHQFRIQCQLPRMQEVDQDSVKDLLRQDHRDQDSAKVLLR